ncbi:MAG: hypothetical protein WAR83_09965 [Flavobacteriales bacterium]|jgi:hypothetical protein|nr:hypothetical protein [Flavobacteriales bacterium]
MKKLIGIGLWLLAFAIPFRYSILDSKDVLLEGGTPDNVTGLLSFVAVIGLLFGGYALVDSASAKPTAEDHH